MVRSHEKQQRPEDSTGTYVSHQAVVVATVVIGIANNLNARVAVRVSVLLTTYLVFLGRRTIHTGDRGRRSNSWMQSCMAVRRQGYRPGKYGGHEIPLEVRHYCRIGITHRSQTLLLLPRE